MATQQIEFFAPSGLTLTVTLHAEGIDAIAYTASAVAEQTNRKGVYRSTFSGVAAGYYQLIARVGSIAVASWWGFAEDTASTFVFGDGISFLRSREIERISDDVRLELSPELERIDLPISSIEDQLAAIAAGNNSQIVISPAAILQNEHFKTTPYNPNPLFVPFKAQKTFSIGIYTLSASGEKVAVNMESKILRVVFENASGGDVGVLENASINKLGNTVTFTSPASAATPPNSARKMMGKWSLREVANDFAWAWGGWEVIDVAYKDT